MIALLWPGARVILCHRDPRDVALSCWQMGFVTNPWSNDWGHIARRFADYSGSSSTGDGPHPSSGWILLRAPRQRPGGSGSPHDRFRSGLEWDPACLEFHANRRVVRTPSLVQVRQPIHTRSVGRWRNQPFIQPSSALRAIWSRPIGLDPSRFERFESSFSPPLLAVGSEAGYDGTVRSGRRGQAGNEGDPRYTIGQIMLVIAVFAASLALPRLINSPDRLVVGCLIGVLATLVLINKVIEVICGKPCPACSRRALRRLARHHHYYRCLECRSQLKRFGFGPWLDASGPDDARRYHKPSEAGVWMEYAVPEKLEIVEQRPPAPEQEGRGIVTVRSIRLPAQPATGGGSRKPRRRFASSSCTGTTRKLEARGSGRSSIPGCILLTTHIFIPEPMPLSPAFVSIAGVSVLDMNWGIAAIDDRERHVQHLRGRERQHRHPVADGHGPEDRRAPLHPLHLHAGGHHHLECHRAGRGRFDAAGERL